MEWPSGILHNVSLWHSNAKLSLPSEPITTFVPTAYCMSAIYGQNGPPSLEFPKHDDSSCSTVSGTSNDVGNQEPATFLKKENDVKKTCFDPVHQEASFLKKENDVAEIINLSAKETEAETEKTVSCFSAMIARSLRSIRKKLRRARGSVRQASS